MLIVDLVNCFTLNYIIQGRIQHSEKGGGTAHVDNYLYKIHANFSVTERNINYSVKIYPAMHVQLFPYTIGVTGRQ